MTMMIETATGLKPRKFEGYDLERSEASLNRCNFLFPQTPKRIETLGFINYVAEAYMGHYGVTITPTDIWFMVIAELAADIKKVPNDYAPLFTTTPGQKQEIVVLTGDPEEINPFAVVNELKARVPTDVDTFLPEFSTTTIAANLSMHVSFCDMVSPYYSYMTLLCGIPTVTLEGTKEDWKLLQDNLQKIHSIFEGKMADYLVRCQNTVDQMLKAAVGKNAKEHFSQIITMKQCGSGSQMEARGWILNFMNHPDFAEKWNKTGKIMQQNFHTHQGKMDYKNLDTGRTFTLHTGIFYSEPKGTQLIPHYNSHRVETTPGLKKDEPQKKAFVIYKNPESGQDKGIITIPATRYAEKTVNPDFYGKIEIKE